MQPVQAGRVGQMALGILRNLPRSAINAANHPTNFHAFPRSVSALNTSRRTPGGDYVSVLRIDEPGTDGLFGLHQLQPVGYAGATGDGALDLHGFDVEVVDDTKLRFWMVNHRPPLDEQGGFLDAEKVGANSTIEVFEVERGEGEEKKQMVHLKTISDAAVITPNKVAATGDGGFVATNDKSGKGKCLGNSSANILHIMLIPASFQQSVW